MSTRGQLRPGRWFGWRWRVTVKGGVWSPWFFCWTTSQAKRHLDNFNVALVEVVDHV